MVKVTNISNGPRGAYKGKDLVFAEPGEEIDADDFNEEWFAKSSTKAAKEVKSDDAE